jgi:hypothetical protein
MKKLWLAKKNLLSGNLLPVSSLIFTSSSFPLPGKVITTFILAVSVAGCINARQNNETQKAADYKKVVTERAAKIAAALDLSDSDIFNKVVDEIAGQYICINAIHEQTKESIAAQKLRSLSGKEMAEAVKKLEEKKSDNLLQQHQRFIAHLKENLTEARIEKVKDGMTYRVFPITYAAYQDMLPGLTSEQKDKIYSWLKEARELAMDEGSSGDKHKIFGKYKGKINNYLSAAGYDMKKEGEAWQKRIKEREAKEKKNKM